MRLDGTRRVEHHRSAMARWKRTKGGRFEWADAYNEVLVVGDLDALRDDERASVPEAIVTALARWRAAWAGGYVSGLPEGLAWLAGTLRGHEPMVSRTICERERVYWHVRLVRGGARMLRYAGPGLLEKSPAADGVARCDDPAALPAPLDWLATMFGTTSLGPELSNTSKWGRPLGAIVDNRHESLVSDPELAALLPEGSREWVSLYEADGDVLVADLKGGGTYWMGSEWTGDVCTDMRLPWRAVVPFLVWSHFEGRAVTPHDLRMLAASRAER